MVQATSSRLAVAMLLAAVALAGCGRKGPPELAPGTQADPVTRVIAPAGPPGAATRTAGAVPTQATVGDPGLIQPPNKDYQVPANTQMNQAASTPALPPINRPPGPKPGKPFALDPLL